jgi:hypothetical protein
MSELRRQRTPRLHPYRITVGNRHDPGAEVAEIFVEAHTLTQARAWFTERMVNVEESSARDVHVAGLDGKPLYCATAPVLVRDDAGQQQGDENARDPELFPAGSEPATTTAEA